MTYILHPGFVRSRSDGQDHYISAARLAGLYGVDIRKCKVIDGRAGSSCGYSDNGSDIHLYPRYNGDYSLPVPGGNK